MTVKDIVCQALCLLGKEDMADAITESVGNGTEMSAEVERYAKLFILIADSVTKELYSGYFPDVTTCRLGYTGEGFDLSELKYPVVRIRQIVDAMSKRKMTNYTVTDGIVLNITGTFFINITYEYTSYDYKSLGDKIADFKSFITPDIVVAGMVAEYYCTIGDTVNAALWQERYESKVKLILDSGIYKPYSEPQETSVRSITIPRRRWV